MSDEGEEFLHQLKKSIEGRVRSQIERHVRVNPYAKLDDVIDIQMRQESKMLENLAESYNDKGNIAIADMIDIIRGEWLLELARELKSKNKW